MKPSSAALFVAGMFLLAQVLFPNVPEYQWATYFFSGIGLICIAIEGLTKTLTQTRK